MIVYTFNNKVLRDSSNKWLRKYINKDVLYYDNTDYSSNNSHVNALQETISPTRRWVVIMFDLYADYWPSSMVGNLYTYFKFNEYWWLTPHLAIGNKATIRNSSNTLHLNVPNSDVSKGYSGGRYSYYYKNITCSENKTYKFVIDTSTTTSNVREYLNTSTFNRTLMATDNMNCTGSISEISCEYLITNCNLHITNVRIAQFDKEEDALVYNGEQTV